MCGARRFSAGRSGAWVSSPRRGRNRPCSWSMIFCISLIALDMGAVFALEAGDQTLVHELQYMLIPGGFGDHVVHDGEEFFATRGIQGAVRDSKSISVGQRTLGAKRRARLKLTSSLFQSRGGRGKWGKACGPCCMNSRPWPSTSRLASFRGQNGSGR